MTSARSHPAPVDRTPWLLDPAVAFLNHGSFGACPVPVLEAQRRWRDRLETQPVAFLDRELAGHLDAAREALGTFIGGDPEGIAFVPNATTGVSTVLDSLRFAPGDELLTTDHEYNATLNALRRAAARDGARVVVARIPFPIRDAADAVDAVLRAVSSRTRMALVSHVTSPTALVLPIEELVAELGRRGIDTLVDGAHAPGMVALDLDRLGAAWYTGNAHKWLCAPKGSAFLWVRADRRDAVHPLVTSHGANDPRTDRSRFRLEFDWVGTTDPTPWLTIPETIRYVGGLHPDGWTGLMAANRALARSARDILARALDVEPPAPDAMLGAMAALPITRLGDATDAGAADLQDRLRRMGFEVPVGAWPVRAARADPSRPSAVLIRVSAQRYVRLEEIERLAAVLRDLS
jgi:isopenicillin-N epimerase